MRTAHPSDQLGNRLICDSLAISYHSRDIDDTIAEEEEPLEDEEDEEANDDDDEGKETGRPTMLGGVGGGARDSRSVMRIREMDPRGKSRSVSPGIHYDGGSRSRRSGSEEGGIEGHDYVNSAPGGGAMFGGSALAIPPPPQQQQSRKQQQSSFNRQQQPPLIHFDSDPYGKEFDAISTDRSRISAAAAGSRTNGRVDPSKWQQQQQQQQRPVEVTKESGFPPVRPRNGLVSSGGGATAWGPSMGPSGDV